VEKSGLRGRLSGLLVRFWRRWRGWFSNSLKGAGWLAGVAGSVYCERGYARGLGMEELTDYDLKLAIRGRLLGFLTS